jgi:hypothetical protein
MLCGYPLHLVERRVRDTLAFMVRADVLLLAYLDSHFPVTGVESSGTSMNNAVFSWDCAGLALLSSSAEVQSSCVAMRQVLEAHSVYPS